MLHLLLTSLFALTLIIAEPTTVVTTIVCPPSTCYAPTTNSSFNSSDFSAWLISRVNAGLFALSVAPNTYTLPAPAQGERAHLVLPPLNDVALDFTGVSLIAADRKRAGVYAGDWFNTSITGLSLHYLQPPSSTVRVLAVDEAHSTVDVAVETGHPSDDFDNGNVASCNVFDAVLRLRKPLAYDVYITNVVSLGGGNSGFRLTVANRGQLARVEAGDLFGCRVVNGEMTFQLDNATNCAVRGVTLYGGPLFGFFETDGGGNNEYTDVAIRLPLPPQGASTQPLLSTSADGFHSAGTRHGPRITRADFTGMDDDAIAIHGEFRLVTDADIATSRVWIAVHGPTAVGDHLLFYDNTFAPTPAVTAPTFTPSFFVITAITPAAPSYMPPYNVSTTMPSQVLPGATFAVLTLSPPPPVGLRFDCVVVNTDAIGAGFIVRDSQISNHRARGMLLKGTDGLVENNTITNSSLGGIIITPELYWREAGFARNVTIRGNTLILTSSGEQSYGGIALGAVAPDGLLSHSGGASAIVIEDNVLVDASYSPIWLNAAGNVTLRGNRLITPFHAATSASLPACCMPLPSDKIAVYIASVQGVLVENNCVQRAPPGEDSLQYLLNVTSDSTGVWEGGVGGC